MVITEGYWDDFNIKWLPSNSLGNFSVFYRVLLTTWPLDRKNILSFEVSQPIVRVTEFKAAGQDINVTILPLTAWAQGVPTTIKLTTPSAAPKQPRNLRVFVDQFREPLQQFSNITALENTRGQSLTTFELYSPAVSPTTIFVHWQEPLELKCRFLNYQLYWQVLNSSLTSHKIVDTFEMQLLNLEPAQEYVVWLEVYSKPLKVEFTQKLVANTAYDSVILECQPLSQEPDISPFSIDLTEVTDNITITNLEPKTKYEFFLA
ncbi:Protein sevenless [Eumeta japonica]|uniref:Protein sevenless n=1 Tax=Eumeta variegata TaxID=151549 RepID=A0A4C1TFW5_EUMVA|nr:Protein sevenless [Eumeta japonica]